MRSDPRPLRMQLQKLSLFVSSSLAETLDIRQIVLRPIVVFRRSGKAWQNSCKVKCPRVLFPVFPFERKRLLSRI
jgi:hypothetical protein